MQFENCNGVHSHLTDIMHILTPVMIPKWHLKVAMFEKLIVLFGGSIKFWQLKLLIKFSTV